MDFKNILIRKKEEGIAWLMVNRPEKRNTLDIATRREIIRAYEDIKEDLSIRVLIISGVGGKVFSSGSDVTELLEFNPIEMEDFLATKAQSVYTRFEQLDKPVIAMIDGFCLGSGLELAMAADIRIASTLSRFGLPEVNVGVIPGGGGTQRLARLVGMGMAKKMIFTGEIIDAETAFRIGLVDEVVLPEKLEETTLSIANKISQKSPLTIKWAKRAINNSQETSLAMGLAYEALVESFIISSFDAKEGMRAFMEKRSPQYRGR